MNIDEQSVASDFGTNPRSRVAGRLLWHLFRDYPGSMTLRLWDGKIHRIGQGRPDFTLVVHTPEPLRNAFLRRDPLRLVDAYLRGEVDLEGDIFASIRLKEYFQSTAFTAIEKLRLAVALTFLGRRTRAGAVRVQKKLGSGDRVASSRAAARTAIAFHYDISNAFYRLWLDPEMVYSCAYFENEGETLEHAQRSKLEHICRKLRLKPGERLLDIGCGWGALICWAARHHGVRTHGITLSANQYEHARRRIREEGLDDVATVELRDYRDLRDEGVFDKIASVGMFEHVGLARLPEYHAIANRLLRPGGLFLNHGITSDSEGWKKTFGTEFINRYVFPGGQLDTASNIQCGMERAGFEILDVEGLRPHYALTLRHWVRRLEAAHVEARTHVSEAVFRLWRLYMAACAMQFEQGGIGVYQVLAAKRGGAGCPVPLTRRDIYSESNTSCTDENVLGLNSLPT